MRIPTDKEVLERLRSIGRGSADDVVLAFHGECHYSSVSMCLRNLLRAGLVERSERFHRSSPYIYKPTEISYDQSS